MGSANTGSAALYSAVQLEQRSGARPGDWSGLGTQPSQRPPDRLVRRNLRLRWTIVANRLGWRLPSSQELTSLIDPTQSSPALPAGSPFQGVVGIGSLGSLYWSAASTETDASFAKAVDFSNGSITSITKIPTLPILQGARFWCVRGGQRFEPPYLELERRRIRTSSASLRYGHTYELILCCVRRRGPNRNEGGTDHAPADRDDEARDQHLLAGADAAGAVRQWSGAALWRGGDPRLSRHRHRARRLSRSRRARGRRNRLADRRRRLAERPGRGRRLSSTSPTRSARRRRRAGSTASCSICTARWSPRAWRMARANS